MTTQHPVLQTDPIVFSKCIGDGEYAENFGFVRCVFGLCLVLLRDVFGHLLPAVLALVVSGTRAYAAGRLDGIPFARSCRVPDRFADVRCCNARVARGHSIFVTSRRMVAAALVASLSTLLTGCTGGAGKVPIIESGIAIRPVPPLTVVSGQLWTAHGAGVVLLGYGPAAGTLTITGAVHESVPVSAADGFKLTLPQGSYVLTGAVHDGYFQSTTITVAKAPILIKVPCKDGLSTD